mmetsp:Transcript_61831/g.157201  ORF Transcript_61831/g.157201 Transcript_61831/m.157201 type:complete len:291 (-) Transcript_61831:246-1118(-)
MEGPVSVPLRLNRMSLDAAAVGGDMRLASGSRGSQARAGSGGAFGRSRQKDLYRGLRCAAPQPSMISAAFSAGGSAAMEERQVQRAVPEDAYLRALRSPGGSDGSATGTAGAAAQSQRRTDQPLMNAGSDLLSSLVGSGLASPVSGSRESDAAPPATIEEFVLQDLERFWRWCPTPIDGLHRCGLLVKLFDYCGLTRKEEKTVNTVWRLDTELRALGIMATDRVEAHQRVSYEDFVQSRRLKDAVARCRDARLAWERRRVGKCEEGTTPLALWVLGIIYQKNGDPQTCVA